MRTNFSMPDVLSIALGGGTHVKVDHDTVRTHTHSHAYIHTQGSPQFIQSSKVIVISSTPAWCNPSSLLGEPRYVHVYAY